MERFKAYEREEFTYEEKVAICQKSDNHCCHCGKLKYIGYGATVDHFIPLHKGGSNRAINLVMLCEECNKEKSDKIMDMTYLPYLKERYKDELSKYLESYITVIDYIARNRLFACDEYSILLHTRATETAIQSRHAVKNELVHEKGVKYRLKLARWDDYGKICDYFEKYLKKYGRFSDREAVEKNITFWMQFGCIYYIERQGDISLMAVYTIYHAGEREIFEGIEYIPNMYIFPYYSSEQTVSLAVGVVTRVTKYILDEQKLKFLPFIVNTMDSDKSAAKITYHLRSYFGNDLKVHPGEISGFSKMLLVVDTCNNNDEYKEALKNEEHEKVLTFSNKFGDVEEKVKKFFSKSGDMEDVGWMIRALMGFEYIRESKLTELAYDASEEEITKALKEQEEKEKAVRKIEADRQELKTKKMYGKLLQRAN